MALIPLMVTGTAQPRMAALIRATTHLAAAVNGVCASFVGMFKWVDGNAAYRLVDEIDKAADHQVRGIVKQAIEVLLFRVS
ncbi:hypothetical protein Haur_1332 [Herpetosiphon aurantiacus DSM 785]|uniref:Uncharacterized protein n=1 Tax=Herpetosiphon aurantiacus (strain ATCC 23779 / DSM 785 / 114-95) TaxID=316274 RepID=A9B2D2_HERA2|nr:hypothetical protein Haur_1332 [Herpetosiphon aurantiacus DSM 785]